MKQTSIEKGPDIPSLSERQRRFYEEECDPEFEITRPRYCGELYTHLIEYKFKTGCEVLGLELAGRTLLEICAGSGMISEKFARAGAIVTATDLSISAIIRARERARRYYFAATFAVADAERLPFPDRSYDLVSVHDGLHHLEHPERAVCEMARIARLAVLIMDPAAAGLTTAAIKLGIARRIEEAGNEVKRLQPLVLERILRDCGLKTIRWRRTLMYYPHQPGKWFRLLGTPPISKGARYLFDTSNLIFGKWGNKLALAALRT
jgi:ubiquinone/menaquinone biosynthesis C-methylase UbiE